MNTSTYAPRYYLSHSGVLNMRWGIRNGPPYPLSRKSDGSLNRTKQDNRKKNTLGNMPDSVLNEIRKQAKLEADEHTLELINSVKKSSEETLSKAQKAKESFDARSREKLGDSIKQEFAAAKAARDERREQKHREKDAAKETAKRLAEEKARAAADDEKEALRQYIRHNPLSLYKYADAFTDQEMDDLIQRLDMDRKIKDVRDQEIYRYKKYLETGVSTITTLANGAKEATNLYNSCANVWNSVGEYTQNKAQAEGKEVKKPFTPLPTINSNNKDGKTFKQANDGKSFVDNNEAEQKAKQKQEKKKQKQNDQQPANGQNTTQNPGDQTASQNSNDQTTSKPRPQNNNVGNTGTGKSFPSKDQVRNAFRNASDSDVNNFWKDINDIRQDKIQTGKWTDDDKVNWDMLMDVYFDYQKGNLSHSDFLDATEDYLEHHGILGMKWGVRRFQNEDGTLTAEGRKRYGRDSSDLAKGKSKEEKQVGKLPEWLRGAFVKKAPKVSEENKPKPAVEDFDLTEEEVRSVQNVEDATKDCWCTTTANGKRPKNKQEQQRMNEAADLGIMALYESGLRDVDLDFADVEDFRDWFLYEDQTIGMPLVADMINQGKTAKEVSDTIDTVEKNYRTYYDPSGTYSTDFLSDDASAAVFDITEGNYQNALKNFAEECEKIKVKQLQDEIDSLKEERKVAAAAKRPDQELLDLVDAEIKELETAKAHYDKPKVNDKPEFIEKVGDGDDARYFYDKDELEAYKDNATGSSNHTDVSNIISLDPNSKEGKEFIQQVEDVLNSPLHRTDAPNKELQTEFQKMRNNSKTDEEKDRKVNAWERARDKDLWDLTFLEAVQNSKILDDGDTTALLTEYAKYLDHPYEYFMNEADKLKSA